MQTLLHAVCLLLAISTYRQVALADHYSHNLSDHPQGDLTLAQTTLE